MDDVLKLAAQAGIGWLGSDGKVTPFEPDDEPFLLHFAALVRAQTLEECARVCDMVEMGHAPDGHRCAGVAWECAAAIRALASRSEPPAQAK